MLFLSFAPLLAQASGAEDAPLEASANLARKLFTPSPGTSLALLGLALLAGIAIQIVAYWIAAKVILGNENGTLLRAARLWLFTVLAGIGLGVLLVICLALAASTRQPTLMLLVAGGWSLLALLVALLLPAKVFETDLLRSFGILVVSFILVLAGQVGLDQAFGHSTIERWRPVQTLLAESPEGRERRLKQLFTGDPLASVESDLDRLSSAEERTKSFSERQEGLRKIFAALEQRRKSIKAGDKEALGAYEAVRQRYEAQVKIMRADYAASLTTSPRATPSAH